LLQTMISLLISLLALAATAAAVIPVGYQATPFGFIRAECHHSVPSGAHLERRADGAMDVMVGARVVGVLPKCPYVREEMFFQRPIAAPTTTTKRQFPSDYNGWLAYTQWQYPNQTIDRFLGSFTVSDNPASDPDVLYIFTGLQNDDWVPIVDPLPMIFDIIQPVLQYPADSGFGWSAKSWFVTLDIGAIASSEIMFKTGDTCFGNMTKTGPTSWFIDSVNVRTGQHTHISVNHNRLALQPWAFTTVECYGCSDTFSGAGCDHVPTKPTQFTGMVLFDGQKSITPQWQAFVSPNPICNTAASIVTPSHVIFNYQ